MSLLHIQNVDYSYPQSSVKALKNINFDLQKGEYVAVLGANGSGKSTLGRLCAQFFTPDCGTVELQKDILPGIVFQQPKEQIVAGVVERDTAFGPQNLEMTKAEIELRTMECLSVTGLVDRALSRTFELSLGQTQRLAFSGILALFPDFLILDEVTAMLDPQSRKELVKFIDQWNAKGHTIIHITHDYEEAIHSKRVVVMENGSIIYDDSSENFSKNNEIVQKIFGKEESFYKSISKKNISDKDFFNKTHPVTLSVENLSFNYENINIFNNISFSLRKGTVTAITGPSGCGKSTLLECLSGLLRTSCGTIKAVGRPVLALQESEASLFEPYAADDVAFGPVNKGISGKELVDIVKKSMNMTGLDYNTFANRSTFNLSGGEKRKLSLAGIIALDSDIMLFDEPTSALDPMSRMEVLKTLRLLADEGKTVLFTTHRMEEKCIADNEIIWSELNNYKAEKDESLSLPVQEYNKNASILNGLHKTAKAFMAPPVIINSFISSLNPVVKYVIFLSLFAASLLVRPFVCSVLMLVICCGYALLAKYPLKKSVTAFKKLLPWMFIFFILQFLFIQPVAGEKILFRFGLIVISCSKIVSVIRSFVRSMSIIILIGTFIYTTGEREILDGLSGLLYPLSLIKVPVRYAVIVTGIIFRFIPLLMELTCGIVKTQIVRGTFGSAKGIKKLKIIIPLLVPLMLQTFRKSQSLADALTARYFS